MYIHISIGYWITTLGAEAFMAIVLMRSLARGAAAAGLSRNVQARVVWLSSVSLGAWAAVVLALASRGVFHYSTQLPFPFLAVGVLAPLLAGAIAIVTVPALRTAVNAIPQQRLIGVQGVRVVGLMFLILMAQRQLPAVFALPAGIGDMLVGLFALRLAREFARGNRSLAASAIRWNLAGILDLVVALSIGFLASSTPYRLIFSTPPTDAMTILPMVMIPVFGIPLFFLEHGISLAHLAAQRSAERFTIEANA